MHSGNYSTGCLKKTVLFKNTVVWQNLWIFRGKIMREIDCAHRRKLKMLPWPWFRENIDFFRHFLTSTWFEKTYVQNQTRWCSDKAAAYVSQRSLVRIPLEAKKFCTTVFLKSTVFYETPCIKHVIVALAQKINGNKENI